MVVVALAAYEGFGMGGLASWILWVLCLGDPGSSRMGCSDIRRRIRGRSVLRCRLWGCRLRLCRV